LISHKPRCARAVASWLFWRSMQETIMPDHAHIVHHLPGRIRVHIPRLKGRAKLGSRICEMAEAIPGVHRAEANPVTGSVLVRYDRHDPAIAQRLAQALEQIDTLISIADPEAGKFAEAAEKLGSLALESPLLASVEAALKRGDSGLLRASNGLLDLPVLLPLLLAGGALLLPGDEEGFLKSPVFLGGMIVMSLHSFGARLRDEQRRPAATPNAPASGR
jgi:hypothetical protein